MLSYGTKMSRADYLRALPEIASPIPVRLKFVKLGKLQYISHLDLQRSFNRIIVRSGIPVWYSKGFNPHIKLVFSTPLSVGTQSECEFLDIRLDRDMPTEQVMELLNAEMTDEMHIVDAYIPSTKFSDIAFCEYELGIECGESAPALASRIGEFFARESIKMVKKSKSGEREINIIPLIERFEARASEDGKRVIISTVLNATTENFLNPELLISAIKQELLVLENEADGEYSIVRKRSLTADLSEFR